MAPESTSGYRLFDFSQLSTKERYSLLIGSIIPRPIALVSTIGADGSENLAPFSFFNGVCSNPPCLSVSIARKSDGSKKDSLLNIETSGEFVVNSASVAEIKNVATCGGEYPYGVSEIELCKLTKLPSRFVKAYRIKESAIQFECKLHKSVEIGDGGVGSTCLVIGEILAIHVSDLVINERGGIDPKKLNPLSRLGQICYAGLGEVLEMKVPEAI